MSLEVVGELAANTSQSRIAEKEKPSKLRPSQQKIRDSPSCYGPPKSRSSLRSQMGQAQQEVTSRKSENHEESVNQPPVDEQVTRNSAEIAKAHE